MIGRKIERLVELLIILAIALAVVCVGAFGVGVLAHLVVRLVRLGWAVGGIA